MNTYRKRFCKSKMGQNKISTTFVCKNKTNIVNFAKLIENAIVDIDIHIKDFACDDNYAKKIEASEKAKI